MGLGPAGPALPLLGPSRCPPGQIPFRDGLRPYASRQIPFRDAAASGGGRPVRQWVYLPHDFPPPEIVQAQAYRWMQRGVFEDLMHDLRMTLRLLQGRAAHWCTSASESRRGSSTVVAAASEQERAQSATPICAVRIPSRVPATP